MNLIITTSVFKSAMPNIPAKEVIEKMFTAFAEGM
jgi:hypothetical protein